MQLKRLLQAWEVNVSCGSQSSNYFPFPCCCSIEQYRLIFWTYLADQAKQGAALQTPSWLIYAVIHQVNSPKRLELG